ncbi:MAG: hypothetical protein ACRC2T_03350 [Thermoguttaceae bacterium]
MFTNSSNDQQNSDLNVPAKEHEEYQQWYESESGKDGKTFNARIVSLLEKKDSPAFSWFVLILVTIFACVAGFLAIKFIPESTFKSYMNSSKMSLYRRVPTDLIGYDSVHAFPVDFDTLTCLCKDAQNRLYVGGDKKISVYSVNGLLLFSINLSDTPTSISVIENDMLFGGCLFVSYPNKFEIYRESSKFQNSLSETLSLITLHAAGQSDLELVNTWKSGSEKSYLRKITANKDAIFVCDAGEKVVYKIDNTLTKVLTIGQNTYSEDSKDKFPGFVIPTLPFLNAVFSPERNILWVTNPGKHRVEAFTPDGEWKPGLAWGEPSAYYEGFCGCCNPTGLEILDESSFVTAEKFIKRVKVCDISGKIVSVVATPDVLDSPPTQLIEGVINGVEDNRTRSTFRPSVGEEYPVQIAVLSNKQIAVLDPTYAVVRIFVKK